MASNPNYLPPLGTAVTPSPGDIVVPNSPQGSSEAANAFEDGFNYVNTISSTEQELTSVLQVQSGPKGVDALPGTLAAPVVINGTPSVQQNTWDSGVVGVPGSKFS